MIRKIRIKITDGVLGKIQCPNPVCENILNTDSSECGNGINLVDMVCDVCGDDVSIEYIILCSSDGIQEMMSAKASFISNNKIQNIKEG